MTTQSIKKNLLLADLCEALRPVLLSTKADAAYIDRACTTKATAFLLRGLRGWAEYVATGATWPLLDVANSVLFSVYMTPEDRIAALLFLEKRGHKKEHLGPVAGANSAEHILHIAINSAQRGKTPGNSKEMPTAAKLVSELVLRRARLHQEGLVK